MMIRFLQFLNSKSPSYPLPTRHLRSLPTSPNSYFTPLLLVLQTFRIQHFVDSSPTAPHQFFNFFPAVSPASVLPFARSTPLMIEPTRLYHLSFSTFPYFRDYVLTISLKTNLFPNSDCFMTFLSFSYAPLLQFVPLHCLSFTISPPFPLTLVTARF